MFKLEVDIKIINSPFQPNQEVAGDLVVKLFAPYSDKDVTVQINPNMVEYKDALGENIRQLSIATSGPDTKTLRFDFDKNKSHKLEMNNKKYEIELIDIAKINQGGKDFPTFHFKVKEL